MYHVLALALVLGVFLPGGECFLGRKESKKELCNAAEAICPPIRCVDAVWANDGCCLTCPTGENCILFGEQIAANHHTVKHIGECTWICRCPGERAYVSFGENTVAVCSMQCGNTYLSPQEVSTWYNLRDPLWRKRDITRRGVLRKLAGRRQGKGTE